MHIQKVEKAVRLAIARRLKRSEAQSVVHDFLRKTMRHDQRFYQKFVAEFGASPPPDKIGEALELLTSWLIGYVWHTLPHENATIIDVGRTISNL